MRVQNQNLKQIAPNTISKDIMNHYHDFNKYNIFFKIYIILYFFKK